MAPEKSLTMFKRAHHLSLHRASCNQFKLSDLSSVRSILILSFPLCLGLTHFLFPFRLPTKIQYAFLHCHIYSW